MSTNTDTGNQPRIRQDNRLSDLPMSPITCETCAAVVLVRKSSWQQTSIQWDRDAAAACHEMRPGATHRLLGEQDFPTCSALRESINRAATNGELMVAQG